MAGYFDGDGNVGTEVVRYVLKFKLRFSDTWKAQVLTVKSFLNREGIPTSALWHETSEGRLDAYRIDVSALAGVLVAAKAMLPFCVKKAEDLRILIDYLEGRVDGNKAIERLNEEVRTGRRSGYIRDLTLPYTRAQGIRNKELENARKARAAYAVNVNPSIQEQIRKDHTKGKLSYVRLSRKYGYSTSVIRRILGAR
ncbi:MAG TPA: hypothetical protein VED22_08040 [Nitrososphaerales archaeon]|nr:hypothetical protein [Nitrososphaerales archaeon]